MAGLFFTQINFSAGNYVCRTRAFFALANLEFDLLAFIKGGVAFGLNLGMMYE